jgi:hypothetical protein
MTPSKEIIVTEIGMIAHTKLAQEMEASVMGITSRGLFLLLSSGWVLFLSPDIYRGPLTLNYSAGPDDFSLLSSGLPARVNADHIAIPDQGLIIHTGQASTWQAPSQPTAALPPSQRKLKLALVARTMLSSQPVSDFGRLIPVVLGFEEINKAQGNPVFPLIERLQQALQEGQLAAIADCLEAILGLGSGLTPSGDDLTAGILLALTRWGHILAPGLEIKALAQDVVQRAYRKTTTLSANLIECASQGQANERLILALDGILSGHPDAPTCADYLAGWGHTSGLDTLAGMALTL